MNNPSQNNKPSAMKKPKTSGPKLEVLPTFQPHPGPAKELLIVELFAVAILVTQGLTTPEIADRLKLGSAKVRRLRMRAK
jgi:hypothetical protein